MTQALHLPLEEELDRWQAVGLISAEIATAIRTYEAGRQIAPPAIASPIIAPPAAVEPAGPPPVPGRAVRVLVEVLAYFGSALALSGVLLVLINQWSSFETWARLIITVSATVVFSVIGVAVPETQGGVRVRLRAALLLAATASAVVLGQVLMHDVRGTNDIAAIVSSAALCGGVLSAVFWQWRNRPLQQATTYLGFGIGVPCAVAAGFGAGFAGIAAWGLSALVLAFALTRLAPNFVMSEALALPGLVVASITIASRWQGVGGGIGVATAFALLALALVPGLAATPPDRILTGVFGGWLLFLMGPATAGFFAHDAPLATGIVMWGLGAALALVGVSGRTRLPFVPAALGSGIAMAGAGVAGGWNPGFGCLAALATAIVVLSGALVSGLVRRIDVQVALGMTGGVGFVAATIATLLHFSRDAAVLTGVVAWVGAVALLVVAARRWVRLPVVVEVVAALLLLGAAAITGRESQGFATLFGLATSVALLGCSVLPGRVLYSLFGCVGIVVFVPWTIGWFFPGENRAPLFVTVSGLLVLTVAVILGFSGRRFRREHAQERG
ncbi:MAG: hypothetical protein ACOYN3_00650 [Acidimicrobiia bacterium]